MELAEVEGEGRESQVLTPGSLLMLSGEARYRWRHAIPGRKTDKVAGRSVVRGRRVSLTFRTVLLGA
jgi:alkylated DNA repair dioxygenase AlkB